MSAAAGSAAWQPSPAEPFSRRRQAQALAHSKRQKAKARKPGLWQVGGSQTRLRGMAGSRGAAWKAWDARLQAQHVLGFTAHKTSYPGLYRPMKARTEVTYPLLQHQCLVHNHFRTQEPSLCCKSHHSCNVSADSRELAWAPCIASARAARRKMST